MRMRVAVSVTASLVVSGCVSVESGDGGNGSGGSEATSEDIVVVEDGYGVSSGHAWMTAVLKNNADHGGVSANVSFNLVDKEGKLLGTSEDYVLFDRPGQVAAVGTSVDPPPGSKPTDVETTVVVHDYGSLSQYPDVKFKPAKVKIDQRGPGVTVYYRNPTTETLEFLDSRIVCWDKAGKINGGGFQQPAVLPPSGAAPQTIVWTSGRPARCLAYTTPLK